MSVLLYCVLSFNLFDNAATDITVLHTLQHVAVMLLHAFTDCGVAMHAHLSVCAGANRRLGRGQDT